MSYPHFRNVRPGSTLYIPFASYAGTTGASVTLTGLAVTDIEVYKNGSITQRASDTGYALLDTDGIDFDAVTGIHGFSIDLASDATAGFFTAGAFYWVIVSAVTIDTQTVNFIAATFDIGYDGAFLNTTIATLASQTSFTLTAGPAEDSALSGCIVLIHDIASAVQLGYGLVTAYTGSTRTVTLAAGTTFTAAAGDNISVFVPGLLPTVAGRTLDITATGAAGIDWANVENQSTTVALADTTVMIDPDQAPAVGPTPGTFDDMLAKATTALPDAAPGAGAGLALAANIFAIAATGTVASVTNAGDFTLDFTGYLGSHSTDGQFARMFLVFDRNQAADNAGIPRQITTYTGATRRVQFSGTGTDIDRPFPTAPSGGENITILGLA